MPQNIHFIVREEIFMTRDSIITFTNLLRYRLIFFLDSGTSTVKCTDKSSQFRILIGETWKNTCLVIDTQNKKEDW